jgi:hypothetical protein
MTSMKDISPMEDAGHVLPAVRTFDLGPRSAWAWLTAGICLLALAESVAFAAIVHALLPLRIGYAIDVLIGVPTLCLLVAIASVLCGRITVDPETLWLRFGLLGGARVPRADINSAERYVPAAIRPVGLGIDVPAGSHQATASRGGQVEFVRLLLAHPVQVRVAPWRTETASELLMGTGSPDQLIAALA